MNRASTHVIVLTIEINFNQTEGYYINTCLLGIRNRDTILFILAPPCFNLEPNVFNQIRTGRSSNELIDAYLETACNLLLYVRLCGFIHKKTNVTRVIHTNLKHDGSVMRN